MKLAMLSVSLIFLLVASAHDASAAETCDEADILYATTPAPPRATNLWRTYLEQMATNLPANLDVLLIGDSLIYQWPIPLLEVSSTHYCWNMSRDSRAEPFVWTRTRVLQGGRPYHSALIPGTSYGIGGDKAKMCSGGSHRPNLRN
jgi:hypothetical protein